MNSHFHSGLNYENISFEQILIPAFPIPMIATQIGYQQVIMNPQYFIYLNFMIFALFQQPKKPDLKFR